MKQFSAIFLIVLSLTVSAVSAADYTLAINGGRVVDPESGLDAIRHVGISGSEIITISEQPLAATTVIDATGMVVSPGFIDLHTHSPTPLGEYYQAFDGVTTALELEAGFFPVLDYASGISAKPLINYGASAGYVSMRMFEKNGLKVSSGSPTQSPVGLKGWITAAMVFFIGPEDAMSASFTELATEQELESLRGLLLADLDNGALGIGLALDYFSAAIQDAEMRMIFEVAAQSNAPIFVHVRRGINGDPTGLREVINYAREYGASVHICHITHNAISNLELFLAEVRAAQADGIDITTEVLPYNAGSAFISAAVFGRDWQTIFNISYEDVEIAASGQRFNKILWEQYRKQHPNTQVIHHYLKEEWTQRAIQEPGVIVVSDLLPMDSKDKKVAPHNGAFSKVLGRYVREQELLDLPTAIAKMTLLPARRLEHYAPIFKRKGRIQVNMDADITIFNPKTIVDNATYANPYQQATGIEHVIVNGQAIISNGQQREGVFPGRRVLAK